jgi:hypothetical protein
MYMKSVCFSAFILHISGTDKCKIGVRYLIFRPVNCTDFWFYLHIQLQKDHILSILLLINKKNFGIETLNLEICDWNY